MSAAPLSRSIKQHAPEGAFDTIVIGSGIGGLAVASALARFGSERVLVLERHDRVGGFTHTFTRKGYVWDVGVHYVGDLHEGGLTRRLFEQLTDGSLAWAPLPAAYDRVVLGGRSYELMAGKEQFLEALSARFPSERAALVRYLDLAWEATRALQLTSLERALPGSVDQVIGPRHARAGAALAARTTLEVLQTLTTDAELIAVLSGQFGNYGLAPARSSFAIHAAMVMHYLRGAWYPVGGADAIAPAFVPVIAESGGALFHSAEVDRVLIEEGRAVGVQLVGGGQLRARRVISDAGAANTYRRLLGPEHAAPVERQALEAIGPSESYACLYLGFRHSDAELGLDGTNLWLYPGGSHDQNVDAYRADPSLPLPMIYVSFPSAKDPAWAQQHPGRATVEVIAFCPWDRMAPWEATRWGRRPADYAAFKQQLTERLLEALFAARPQLRGKVDHAELSTPLSVRHFAGHPRGELYGLAHNPARVAHGLSAQTSVPGLLLTGADLVTGGIAGALTGGALCACAVLGPTLLQSLFARGR